MMSRIVSRTLLMGAMAIGAVALAETAANQGGRAPSATATDTAKPASVPVVESESRSAKPYGLKQRTTWTNTRLVGTPDPPPPYTVERAFPNLKFDHPVFIAQEPGTDRMLVAELSGKIRVFPLSKPQPEHVSLFLDIKRQIYAFSFHPQYEQNGQLFVFSPQDPADKSPKKQSRVSRFVATGKPRKGDPKSEEVLIEWLAGGHNGGEALIGPDGYLYVSTGDQSGSDDGNNTGQGVDDLFSVIMRIDVDHPDPGKAYGIPADNPFVDFPGARPEIWAFGFRNPWRMSFDQKTGQLWVGDVGQDLWEMIWLVERGGNYGWSAREGDHPFHPNTKIGPGPISPPVVEHHHSEARSITGGYVYYGPRFPELNGVYVYGDYEFGTIWGVKHDGQKVLWKKQLADTSLKIPSFGVGRDGEFYALDHQSGEVHRLVRRQASRSDGQFPRKLSETGLFASTADHVLAPGVIPYSVNTAQWLDGAQAQRFLGLPGSLQFKVNPAGAGSAAWGLSDGSVVAETISMEMETGQPESRRRIETRVLLRHDGHLAGYSYVWNAEQTDAELVEARGRDLTLQIKDRELAESARRRTWHVPSRNECMFCHSRASGFVLGLSTQQLNRQHTYAGGSDNQLRVFSHIGLLSQRLIAEQKSEPAKDGSQPKDKQAAKPDKAARTTPEDYPALPNAYDRQADLNARARAYLHVNCSVCHVSAGGGNAPLQVRYDRKILDLGLINEKPIHGDFGITDAKIVTPGDPYASVLFYRISKLGRGRMPHVGSLVADQEGIALLHEWISRLKPDGTLAPPQDAPSPASANMVAKLRDWPRLSSEERTAQTRQWLSSTRDSLMLTWLIAGGHEPPKTRGAIVSAGVGQPNPRVRDLFERFVPEEQRVVRLGDQIRAADILALQGNAVRGRKFFLTASAAQCRNCHRVGDVGGSLGPDLTAIGKRLKPHELVESLLEPSKKIDPKFTTHVVLTEAGRVLTGVVIKKTKEQIDLSVLEAGKNVVLQLPRSEIEDMLPQKKSMMPDGLLRGLTAQEAADLLAFLISLRGTQP